MEENPETPPADDTAPGGSAPYGIGHRVGAVVMLIGASLLAYIALDVISGGRLTEALSAAPDPEGDA